jgi:hypothetical protein
MVKYATFALLTALLTMVTQVAQASDIAGNVELIEGKVWIQGDNNKMRTIKIDQPIFEGDTIITGADGELQVRMKDDAFIAVRANSKLKIDNYRAEGDTDDKAAFSLLLGTFRSVTGWIGKYNRNNYSIKTVTATIGVRGTDHEPMYIPPAVPGMPPIGEPGVYDKVNSGRIVVKNQFGEVEFEKGQAAFVSLGSRQAAVRLQGIPEFFKPSRHEQRIEDARNKLQSGIENNLIKRQQSNKSDGIKTRPLLKPQTLHDRGFAPDTRTDTPSDKIDNKESNKHPLLSSPAKQESLPAIQKTRPETIHLPLQKLPSTLQTPAAPTGIKHLPAIQTPVSPITPTSKLAPLNKQSSLLPTAPNSGGEQTAITSGPTLLPHVATPMLTAPQLDPPPVTTDEKSTSGETVRPTTKLVSPTLIQQTAPAKLVLPTK